MILRAVEHLALPKEGESVCGDALVVRRGGSTVLMAIVDALGHGVRAAEVASRAASLLDAAPLDQGALAVIEQLHEGLRGTRGACGLVCLITPDGLQGCSVGNVELRTSGIDVRFVLTPGVLGARMQRPRLFGGTAKRHGRIVAYSDGVSARFHLDDFADSSTSEACRAIFERCRRPHDDASLLVADVDV